ncbi:unnamed protein product, partial [Laminaria digitata]
QQGDRAPKVVFDCSSKLSREVTAGRIRTGEDDDGEMVGEGGKSKRDLSKPDFNLMKSLQL